MDWSKAKSVLIIGFIATNLFLFFNIHMTSGSKGEEYVVTKEFMHQTEEHLKSNGIHLKTEIPAEVPSMSIMVVSYKNFHPEKTIKSILGSAYEKQVQTLEDTILKKEFYKSDLGEIMIEAGKKLTYESYHKEQRYISLNEKKVTEIGERFLRDHGLRGADIVLSQIYYGVDKEISEDLVYKLVYNQEYQEKFLGESYIDLYITTSGVVGMEAMLLEYEKTEQQKKQVIPATDALMRAMDGILEENKAPVDITEIEVGYYFTPSAYLDSDWKDIVSGTAFPAWKITIENGKTYFIEAYKN